MGLRVEDLDLSIPAADQHVPIREQNRRFSELEPVLVHIGNLDKCTCPDIVDLSAVILAFPISLVCTAEDEDISIFQSNGCMFVADNMGVACAGEISGLRVIQLGAGEDVVIACGAADQQNLSVGKESSGVTKAPDVQTLCRSKRFCGRLIDFGSGCGLFRAESPPAMST